ncbi:MAG: DUF4249 family protein, partial [Bacteroidales bacterium]
MKLKFILPVLWVLSLVSCKEAYNPVIDKRAGAIVVEGLITNLKEPYEIKISMATPYESTANNTNLLEAAVSIKDNWGNTYMMHKENYREYYYSDTSEFVALPGRSYTLHIEMPDGEIYESSAQKLSSPAIIDSIYGIITNKNFWYYDASGNITYSMEYGAETFMDLSYNSDSVYQFRFDNTLMKCFSFMYMYTPEMTVAHVPFPPPKNCAGAVCPYIMYNWKKFNLYTGTNLSSATHNIISNEIKNSSVCFFPFDTAFCPIRYITDSCINGGTICATIRQPAGPEGKILETRVYALNQESAVYYQELQKQISYQGKLFDPVSVQLEGNIKCISNPDKLALGLFEASACTTKSYWLRFNYSEGHVNYLQIRDLSGLPVTGTSKYLPDFWLV